MRTTFIGLVGFLLLPIGSLAQDVTIASPTKDSSVTPGQKLKIVLQFQGTTSSVNHIAFSTGFKTTSKKDPTSLGRPYVGSVFPSPQSTDVVLDASKGTYTYEIDVPAAKDFLDGFSAPYELTVSDTYLLGATFTPSLKLTSVTVNMQNNNSTNGGSNNTDPSANNPSGGTGSNTSPVPGGSSGSPANNKPRSGAGRIHPSIYSIFILVTACLLAA